MRLLSVLLLCFLGSSNLLGAYPDSLWAVQQLQCARELLPAQPDSAMAYAKESWAVFQRNDDLYNWLSWHQKIGKTWREKLDKPFIAVDILQKGIAEKSRSPRTEREYKRLAWLYAETGRTYEKSIKDYASTRDYYRKAKAIFVGTLGQEGFTVAKYIYTNLGNAYTRLRDFEHAEYYLGKVRRISSEAGEWSKYVEGSSDLSKAYINQGKYKKAVEVLEEGLQWKDSIAPRAQWFLYEGLAIAHYRAENYAKALPYLDRAQRLLDHPDWPLSDEDYAFLRQEIWTTKGRVYKGLKQYGKAEDYFVRARQILDVHFAGKAPQAFAFLNIYQGWLYYEWGKPESAVPCFQAALQNLLDGFEPKTILDNPSQDQLGTASLLTFAFEGKAAALMDQYQAGAVGEAGVKSAIRCYDLAEAVYQKLWEQYILEGSKLTALKDRRVMREAAVDAAYVLWQLEGGTHWVEKMFALSEQSRALLLMEQLQTANALEQAPTNSIRQTYRQLNTEVEYLSYTLHHAPQRSGAGWAARADSIEKRIRAAKYEQRALLEKAAELFPGGHDQNAVSARHFHQQLQKGEALVEYFITGGHLYVFVLDPDQDSILTKRLDWNEEWAYKAASLKEDLYSGRGAATAYVSKARALYQHLVDPVLQLTAAQHLILVPDGVL
ncbi:MAG TPA: tetratricopeptide repeat protein, partial [Phaeodactylibacter sp.]|nr:tetratricopeptide repeat protein [Phaeodactylibacter sp.]